MSNRPRLLICALTAALSAATVAVLAAAPSAGAVTTPRPGTYVPVSATNLLDTGAGIGVATHTPVPAHGTVTVQIAGRTPIPATGVSAVAMTVAVTSTGGGYLTVYPAGGNRPGAASLDFAAGQTTSNLAYAKLGTGGSISLFNGTSGTSRLYVNVSGYFVGGNATDAATYVPLPPANVLDTGTGVGTNGHVALVPAHGSVTVTVAGQGGVLATGAASAALNVAVISTSGGGFLTAYAADQNRPAAASVDFPARATVATLTTIGMSSAGAVTFYNGSTAGIRVVANVFGYYLAGSAAVPGSFVQVTPTNLYDSAVDGAPIQAHAAVDPAAVSEPSRAEAWSDGRSALVLAVAVVNPSTPGYLTAYSAAQTRPGAANLDFSPGRLNLNGAVVQVTDGGDVELYNGSSAAIRAVVNLFGYYLDGPASSLHWTGPTDLSAGNTVTSVSCTSATACFAVDEAGEVLTHTPTGWTTAVLDATNAMLWISCLPSKCVAVDEHGGARTLTASGWSTRVVADPAVEALVGVSCPTATFCMAVGVNGDAVASNGTAWGTPVQVNGAALLTSVSCTSSSFCAATDDRGGVYLWNGSSWSARVGTQDGDPVVIPEIWCTAPTFCVLADDASVQTFNGAIWSPATTHMTSEPTTVMCTSTTFCVVVGTGDEAVTFDGTQWSVPTHLLSGVALPEVHDRPESVFCTSQTSCVLVNDQTAWTASG